MQPRLSDAALRVLLAAGAHGRLRGAGDFASEPETMRPRLRRLASPGLPSEGAALPAGRRRRSLVLRNLLHARRAGRLSNACTKANNCECERK